MPSFSLIFIAWQSRNSKKCIMHASFFFFSEMRRETMNLLKKIKLRLICSKGQNQFNIDRSTYRTDETKL